MNTNPHATATVGRYPLHAMLVPVPVVCFLLTLVSDVVYWQTAAMLWADASAWLLALGLVFAAFAVIAGIVDVVGDARVRALRAVWVHASGNAVLLTLEFFNALIHTRDAYTSVVPTGLIISVLSVAVLMVTGWNGWALVYRHGVGISGNPS